MSGDTRATRTATNTTTATITNTWVNAVDDGVGGSGLRGCDEVEHGTPGAGGALLVGDTALAVERK